MRVAVAALLLSGCAASEYRVQRPDPCVCVVPCRTTVVAAAGSRNERIVYGARIYPGFAEELEARWGTPLESSFPKPVISPSDEVAFTAWLKGVEPAVMDALRIEIDREYARHVEDVEHARAQWLDAIAGRTSIPATEAKFLLDAAVDEAVEGEARVANERGAELFLAKTSAFSFPSSLSLDMQILTDGTKLEAILVQDISRARLADLTTTLRRSMARHRSSDIAPSMLENQKTRWAWAKKKP